MFIANWRGHIGFGMSMDEFRCKEWHKMKEISEDTKNTMRMHCKIFYIIYVCILIRQITKKFRLGTLKYCVILILNSNNSFI